MARKKRTKTRSFSLVFVAAGFSVLLLVLGVLLSRFVMDAKTCANSISCIRDLSGNYEEGKESTFLGKKVYQPSYLARNNAIGRVLGRSSGEKRIYVDLATQRLTAMEGKNVAYIFSISSGKWGRTPTGDFRIWIKLRNAHMEGGSGADYYNLYNVPYTMFFSNNEVGKERGFSLHGAYWHNNFGYPMSHGCVNMRPEDAALIYAWADPPTLGNQTYATKDSPGTLITIFGDLPTD